MLEGKLFNARAQGKEKYEAAKEEIDKALQVIDEELEKKFISFQKYFMKVINTAINNSLRAHK